MDAPSRTKCIGASICVPLCAPKEYLDNVKPSPLRMSLRNSKFMGASPSYTGVVLGSRVAVASIHPVDVDMSAVAVRVADWGCGVHANAPNAAEAAIVKRTQLLFVRMYCPLLGNSEQKTQKDCEPQS